MKFNKKIEKQKHRKYYEIVWIFQMKTCNECVCGHDVCMVI